MTTVPLVEPGSDRGWLITDNTRRQSQCPHARSKPLTRS
jgi:hypothetical protein